MPLIKKISENNISYARQDKGFLWVRQYSGFTCFFYLLVDSMPFLKNYFAKKILQAYYKKNESVSRVFLFGLFKVNCGAGFIDRLDHLRKQIAIAYKRQQIPIIPPLVLTFKHNNNKVTFEPWSRYIDLNHVLIQVNDDQNNIRTYKRVKIMTYRKFFIKKIWILPFINFKVCDFSKSKTHIKKFVRRTNREYGNDIVVSQHNKNMLFIKFSNQVEKIAKQVASKLGNYYVFHVRRGDRIKLYRKNNVLSQPSNILKALKEYVPMGERLYLMSDEKNRSFFDPIKKYYDMYQHYNFPELRALVTNENSDNYFLFAVELLLYGYAKNSHAMPLIKKTDIKRKRRRNYSIRYYFFTLMN